MTTGSNPEVVMVSRIERCPFTNEWYDIASENHFWMQWRFSVFQRLLKKLCVLPTNRLSVLEIGCGMGVFLRQMERYTRWEIDGADINLAALKRSLSKKSRLLFYDIMEKRPEFGQSYDIVILMDVLEHIESPGVFLEAALFHVRPKGFLLINVPALQGMYSVYDEIMGHLRRYDCRRLRQELGIAEGRRMVTSYWGFTLLPVLFMRKLLLSGKSKKKEIVRKGFEPQGPVADGFLNFLMRLEGLFFNSPPIGTSLMAAVFVK